MRIFDMRMRKRLLHAMIPALLFLPGTGSAVDCSVSAFDFYINATRAGWKFNCLSRSTVTPNGTLIPMPTGDVVCVGKMGIFDGTIDLFVTKPSYLTSYGSNLREGWFTKDWIETPSSARSIWRNARTHVTYARIRANQNFRVGLMDVVFTKNGGNCGNLFTEIF